MPASALCLERWFERPTIARAVAWGATVALQALTSWYLAVFTLVLQAILLLDVAVRSIRRRTVRSCWQLAATGALVAAVLWPFANHYRSLGRTDPVEAAMYSADAAAYLVPPADTWLGKAWTARKFAESRWIWGERTLFLGWTALVFAVIGVIDVVWQRKWRIAWVYGTLYSLGWHYRWDHRRLGGLPGRCSMHSRGCRVSARYGPLPASPCSSCWGWQYSPGLARTGSSRWEWLAGRRSSCSSRSC